jgi:hypothetical protein
VPHLPRSLIAIVSGVVVAIASAAGVAAASSHGFAAPQGAAATSTAPSVMDGSVDHSDAATSRALRRPAAPRVTPTATTVATGSAAASTPPRASSSAGSPTPALVTPTRTAASTKPPAAPVPAPPAHATSAAPPRPPGAAAQSGTATPAIGVYAGPPSHTATGVAAFTQLAGAAPGAVLDFASSADWNGIAAPQWVIAPHAGSAARFELSLPMLPDSGPYSLAACAAGAYNDEWTIAARNLVAGHEPDAVVRPGWEFNGTWYRWSAKNDIAGYVGCFRQIVVTMRAVAGQRFAFDWNPNLGGGAFPAEQAYPGDAYVDYVGVDAYDTSWTWYATQGTPTAAQAAAAWSYDLNGDHGLKFWSTFAAAHHKSMAITEWGVTAVGGGHGGGDDAAFVQHMFDFMTDPANHVAYMHYFDTPTHQLTGATPFPAAAAVFHQRAMAVTAAR